MGRLEVRGFSLSLDGYGAGPDQRRDQGLGRGGESLHEWMCATRTWFRMQGGDGGEAGVDDDYAARGLENVGAWIMGRSQRITHPAMNEPRDLRLEAQSPRP